MYIYRNTASIEVFTPCTLLGGSSALKQKRRVSSHCSVSLQIPVFETPVNFGYFSSKDPDTAGDSTSTFSSLGIRGTAPQPSTPEQNGGHGRTCGTARQPSTREQNGGHGTTCGTARQLSTRERVSWHGTFCADRMLDSFQLRADTIHSEHNVRLQQDPPFVW